MIRIAQTSEELFWSDEDESDEKYLVKQLDGDDGDDNESLDSFQINENRDHLESSIIGSDRLIDHRRSRFTGYITVDKTKRGNAAIALKQPQQLQMPEYPHVPSNVREILGDKSLGNFSRSRRISNLRISVCNSWKNQQLLDRFFNIFENS